MHWFVEGVEVGREVVGEDVDVTMEVVVVIPTEQGLLGMRFAGPFIASTMVFVKINGTP